jgi:hypothetical protein
MKLFRVKETARRIHGDTNRQRGGSITPAALQSLQAEGSQPPQDTSQNVGGAPARLVNTNMSLSART